MKTKKIIIKLIAIALLMNTATKAQDTISKTNKEIIIAKIVEVSGESIKYIRMDNLSGPTYTISKTEVNRINYKNGMVDNFKHSNVNTEFTAPVETKVIDTSAHYVITLNDGTRLKGKLIRQDSKEVVILDNNFGEKKLLRTKIKTIEMQYSSDMMVVTLTDGTIITGKIRNRSDEFTVIETKDLGTVTINNSKIKQTREYEEATVSNQGSIWFKNPNCSRYLFAPSAFQLKKGEGYYQNIYGIGNAINYGITNHATIGAGLTGPFGVYINAKFGCQVVKNVNVAGGVLLGNSFFQINDHNFGIGLGFGVVTIGNYDHNITIGAGYGLTDNSSGTTWMNKPLYVANGMVRTGKKFALVSENWVVNVKGNPFGRTDITDDVREHYEVFYSYAFRYMGQKSTLDAGFVNTPGLFQKGWYIGVPYIGFVIRFGKYREE